MEMVQKGYCNRCKKKVTYRAKMVKKNGYDTIITLCSICGNQIYIPGVAEVNRYRHLKAMNVEA